MKYAAVKEAVFLRRPNRFVAYVQLETGEQKVHVKNTGRCKELLVPGARVILEKSTNPNRKTPYSLIAVYKGERLVNMDSQAPNQVVYEAVRNNQVRELPAIESVRREVTFGGSRFDLSVALTRARSGFIEVKGVTLENDGIVMFPDAPTARGTKHVLELIQAAKQGYIAVLFFLIQMHGVHYFRVNDAMDPKFADAVMNARQAGVQILAYDTQVQPDFMSIGSPVDVRL